MARDVLSEFAKFKEVELNEEEIAHLRQSIEDLVAQGPEAVPAIAEFLESKDDFKFKGLQGENLVKFASLRVLAISALEEIGGPEAVELAVHTLKNTVEPLEMAIITRTLEKQVPAEHRQEEVTVARETLAKALAEELPGLNPTPLFEILQKYGDGEAAKDLEQGVAKWNYYATLALAGLSDGAGVPALIRLSRDPSVLAIGKGDVALRPLAQASLTNQEARTALVSQARSNEIPEAVWPELASTLAGNHIQYGNMIFGSTTAPVVWSPEQIRRRLAIIDEVRAAVRSPAAISSLESAKASLLERLQE